RAGPAASPTCGNELARTTTWFTPLAPTAIPRSRERAHPAAALRSSRMTDTGHPDARLHGAFGQDSFGRGAERAARFFGTPQYILGQTIVVVIWIILNAVALVSHWDPYPFILLNLAFSTQAAYAAPLILLAQTRQADRDKVSAMHVERRHDEQQRRTD